MEIGKIPPCAETGWEFVMVYAAQYQGALRYPCSEIEAVQWFPLETLQEWINHRPSDFASGFLVCWDLFRKTTVID